MARTRSGGGRGRLRPALLALVALVAPVLPASAQTTTMGGFLQLDRRFELGGDSVLVADFYNRFRPELSAVLDPRLSSS